MQEIWDCVTSCYLFLLPNDRFVVSFIKPGHHLIEMRGWVEDLWGNRYEGGGLYDTPPYFHDGRVATLYEPVAQPPGPVAQRWRRAWPQRHTRRD
jgi:hypothetical protein